MPPKKRGERERGDTYSMPKWWRDLAREKIKLTYGDAKRFAATLASGPDAAARMETRISRLLTNVTPTLSLVERMSRVLCLPMPFVVASTEEEALAIDEARKILRARKNLDSEFIGIMTGVDSP